MTPNTKQGMSPQLGQITELVKALNGDKDAALEVIEKGMAYTKALDQQASFKAEGGATTEVVVADREDKMPAMLSDEQRAYMQKMDDFMVKMGARMDALEAKMEEKASPPPTEEREEISEEVMEKMWRELPPQQQALHLLDFQMGLEAAQKDIAAQPAFAELGVADKAMHGTFLENMIKAAGGNQDAS